MDGTRKFLVKEDEDKEAGEYMQERTVCWTKKKHGR